MSMFKQSLSLRIILEDKISLLIHLKILLTMNRNQITTFVYDEKTQILNMQTYFRKYTSRNSDWMVKKKLHIPRFDR